MIFYYSYYNHLLETFYDSRDMSSVLSEAFQCHHSGTFHGVFTKIVYKKFNTMGNLVSFKVESEAEIQKSKQKS